MPENIDNFGSMDDGDSDLEAELAAIAGGDNKRKKPAKPKPKLMPTADLDNLVAQSMRDIPSDEEISGINLYYLQQKKSLLRSHFLLFYRRR